VVFEGVNSVQNEFAFDLSAASWRKDIQDERAFVEALATRFEQALPGHTSVERSRGLFVKNPRVQKLELTFHDKSYLLEFTGGGIQTFRATVVRGIRLKTEPLPTSAWLQGLSEEVTAMAAQQDEVRDAVERFLMS
jgi:hypothetical protein